MALAALTACTTSTHAALITYTPDANTLHLYTFDEAAGGSSTANSGTMGGAAITIKENQTNAIISSASTNTPDTSMLGQVGHSALYGNAVRVDKGNVTVPSSTPGADLSGNSGIGYDFNNSGTISQFGATGTSPDRVTNYNNYFTTGSYTFEAMIKVPSITASLQTIVSFESNVNADRSIAFQMTAGTLRVQPILSAGADPLLSDPIPTTGPDAWHPDNWYHIAVVYNHDSVTPENSTTQFYWTLVDESRTEAASLGASVVGLRIPGQLDTAAPNLAIGTDGRRTLNESLDGLLDNVRISNVARGADEFIFTVIPEPSAFASLAGIAVLGFAASGRRRRAAI